MSVSLFEIIVDEASLRFLTCHNCAIPNITTHDMCVFSFRRIHLRYRAVIRDTIGIKYKYACVYKSTTSTSLRSQETILPLIHLRNDGHADNEPSTVLVNEK